MSDDMSAYKDVFLSESAEYVQAITEGLLALEGNPNDLEPVETVFRGAHSLKGMSATMGYTRTAELTHTMESLMDTVRKREQAADSSLIDLMLRAVDAVKELIDDESSGNAAVDVSELVSAIVARTESRAAEEPAAAVAPESAAQTPTASAEGGALYRVRITLSETCVLKAVRAYMAIKRLGHMGSVVETEPSAREIEDEAFDRSFSVIVRTRESEESIVAAISAISEIEGVEVEVAEEPAVVAVEERPAEERPRKSVPKLAETQTVRVSIGHLDSMVNLVGELVIIRSRLDRLARDLGSTDLAETLSALEQISAELQHEVMQTRMVPVGNIFNRFPRMVRDLARDLGRAVAFEMGGLDIELDRTVLDEIGDPIVHLLRNALDHGIEPEEERVAAGKPRKGTVRLEAGRDRDLVRIVVADDGRGMDPERIWSKAVERGLVQRNERESYTLSDIFMLTCEPGFSTAEKTTAVSGRGVGMDVVKGKIEYLGGTITIHSEVGRGSRIVLTLPLTLAIIQSLLVGAGEQIFAVPLSAVTEVLARDEVKLKTVDGAPVVVLRDGSVAPLFRLDEVIGSAERRQRMPEATDHIVLMESAEQVRALAVQHLVGRHEVVIKPLSPLFKDLRGLGGATVLGDGRVALILDPRTLFGMGV
ncbi:MAG: chemotaxis protein CheA [Actinobacteria bacterium HGW-Actinobacteria-1]|jgi:two-component system chemotaxis sensor kinase CheA|nr:MAG: chemotaxis protein CheA [Actinobacteria bacterium HGW-Actinobacteria-1]